MKFRYIITGIAFLAAINTGCKKLIEVNAPVTGINAENVYKTDATARAVLTSIYARMSDLNYDFSGNNLTAISLHTAASADELSLYDLTNSRISPVYKNDLSSQSSNNFWSTLYSTIFVTNAAIEGLNNAGSLTPSIQRQLLGEAKFMRAFCYFYLVNLFGDVPLAVTTNWETNAQLARSPKALVYQQIITDLSEAETLLSNTYLASNLLTPGTERVRPTKWAAAALLARAYLYNGDYTKAEAEATTVINNASLFSLTPLNNVFLKNSTEAIWQLQPVRTGAQANTGEGAFFVLPPTGPRAPDYPVYLSNFLMNSFESGDQRKVNWVNNVTVGTTTYNYAYKYKIGKVNTSTQEYVMILRLSEQYLIRAEARAQQGNIGGAQADLNVVRNRAGLPNTTANDKNSLLAAIQRERQIELFTEWGHRWLDLKRTGNIDAVMTIVAPQKGGTWSSYKAFYPIPQSELDKAPNVVQNTGY